MQIAKNMELTKHVSSKYKIQLSNNLVLQEHFTLWEFKFRPKNASTKLWLFLVYHFF